MSPHIVVREIELKDIDLIADYWLKSDPDYWKSLGVDLNKLPIRSDLIKMLTQQINTPYKDKKSFALIVEVDGQQAGHTNINGIDFAQQAYMHLHIWQSDQRRKGIGTEMIKQALPFYFDKFELQELFCQPYAYNPAPNKTLEKLGFKFVKQYTTVPGSLNFEQEVKLWELTRKDFENLGKKNNHL